MVFHWGAAVSFLANNCQSFLSNGEDYLLLTTLSWDLGWLGLAHSFTHGHPVPPACFFRRLSSHKVHFGIFVKTEMVLAARVYIWVLYSILLLSMLVFVLEPFLFCYYGSAVYLQADVVVPSFCSGLLYWKSLLLSYDFLGVLVWETRLY